MTAIADIFRPNLAVEVASGEPLDVRKYSVSERTSDLFQVRLGVVSPNPEVDFERILGREASFSLSRDNLVLSARRRWTGVCIHIQQVEVEEAGLSTYELVIVPTLWFLGQRRNHRIFQQLSDLEIVLALLAEWGIQPVLKVVPETYKKRKYRVQYAETDYDFIKRLLEDAGITFYFDDGEEGSVLVLHDAPHDNPTREPAIPFIDAPMVEKDMELVTDVRVGQRTRPGKYTIFDHDYRRPSTYKLGASHTAGDAVEQRMERFHYVPGAFLFRAETKDSTPAADDKGAARHDEGEGKRIARIRMEAKRVSARTVTFRTNVIELRPGSIAQIVDHPRHEMKDRLLIVHSTYEGTSHGEWVHRVEAVSAEMPYRPALVTPKPKVGGVESATVVGPPGEEIHTDEFGRVRVHFPWDRESQMNHHSSCWIHVSQSWGGAGYGGIQLPRIGQEVIVDFLGGDPDRPIIIGRVYTNLQKVPYALPANKTQSGLRSASSPATGGFNELRFEDLAGKEMFRLQAEKDYSGLIKNDAFTHVQNNRTDRIDNNDCESVGGDQLVAIGKNKSVAVEGNEKHLVKGEIQMESTEGAIKLLSAHGLKAFSESPITLQAGGSVIMIAKEFILIQAPMVYINPGQKAPPPPAHVTLDADSSGFSGSP